MAVSLSTAKGLSQDEIDVIEALKDRLARNRRRNKIRRAYYEAEEVVQQLGIAIPPSLKNVQTVVGWPATVVDALAERLTIDGFTSADTDLDELGVPEWWADNGGQVEAGMALTDSMIYGVTFLAVSNGAMGEPDQLLTIEPATTMTGNYSARKRALTEALLWMEDGDEEQFVLSTPTGWIEGIGDKSGWYVDRTPHSLGRVPVVPIINKPRAGKRWGQSEITKPLMSYTDTAVRTLLGMEVSREFYSSPQRYILGAKEDSFQDAEGNAKTGWEVYLGRFLALERDEDGELPQVGQFTAASPSPYIDGVKMLAEQVAAEGALPVSYLGFHTDNPPGGDGIRAMETRLVKRAELRQTTAGPAFAEAVEMALTLRDGDAPRITTRWRDPATPTKAATADAIVKYVSADVLPRQSRVTWELMGLDKSTIDRLEDEMREQRAREMVASLRAAASTPQMGTPTAPVSDTITDADA